MNSQGLEPFFNTKIALLLIFLVAGIFSFWSPYFEWSFGGFSNALMGTPKYWFDEGFVVESARGLSELGKLDIAVEPGVLSGTPYYANSPGFPVALPLAGVFSVFGAGLLQVRIVAFIWFLLTLTVTYGVWKKIFDTESAFWGTLLIATFAPVFANGGNTTTGEITGFFFLVLSLYFIYSARAYEWGGVLAALALVTKPSIFMLIVPAYAFAFAMLERPFIAKTAKVMLGAVPIIVFWLFIMFPNPFDLQYWRGALSIYTDHYPLPSLLSRLSMEWVTYATHSTLLYFSALTTSAYGALYWYRDQLTDSQKGVILFTLGYAIVDFVYFLFSPGWFRYLVVFQMFTLLLFFPATRILMGRIWSYVPHVILLMLVLVQMFVFINSSQVNSGLGAKEASDYINAELAENQEATVGIIDSIHLSSLISTDRKFLTVNCGGGCGFGTHPLAVEAERMPDLVVISRREGGGLMEYQDVIATRYNEPTVIGGFKIYAKR